MRIASVTPHSDPNADLALVSNNNIAPGSLTTVSQINRASLAHLDDHAYHIDCARLNDLLDRIEPCEGKAVAFNACIIAALLNCSSVVQC